MDRYPKTPRVAAIKCVACNAPVTRTVAEEFVCVECGAPTIRRRPNPRTH